MHAYCQFRTKSPTLSENAIPQCNYLASASHCWFRCEVQFTRKCLSVYHSFNGFK